MGIAIDQVTIRVNYTHTFQDISGFELPLSVSAEVVFGKPAEAGEYEDSTDYIHISAVSIGAASIKFLDLPKSVRDAIEARCMEEATSPAESWEI